MVCHEAGSIVERSKCNSGDFPPGPVVKNLLYNAGGADSVAGQGTKIPHSMELLSLPALSTELALSEAHATQLETPRAATTEPTHHS